MDFRVSGKNSIDFCDPLNPQFIPVVDMRSPVVMTIGQTGLSVNAGGAKIGEEVRGTLTLKTASGKLIAPGDLLVVHTKKLHLLIADPTLEDYQHVHPALGKRAGEWTFAFTPTRAGIYRVFADFTPAATARGLYANADLMVAAGDLAGGGTTAARESMGRGEKAVGGVAAGARAGGDEGTAWKVEQAGYRFSLEPGAGPVRARQPADLKFTVTKLDGARVPLEPVMGAFAHLVAFDNARKGFAHLHPMEADLAAVPDAVRPTLSFKITIPNAGRYVIWAQVNLGGRETFVPFWFEVAP